MISEKKIKLYKKYNGDMDGWVRNNSKKEFEIMSDNDWFLIDSFLQDLNLLKRGLVSLEFKNGLENKLKENCESDKAIKALRQIVGL